MGGNSSYEIVKKSKPACIIIFFYNSKLSFFITQQHLPASHAVSIELARLFTHAHFFVAHATDKGRTTITLLTQ